MADLLTLVLPFPPSVNSYWRSPNRGALKGRTLISDAGRRFRTNAVGAVLEQLRRRPAPITSNVSVSLTLYPPNRARRDIDNYTKATFDAMTHAGVWGDDNQIKRMLVEWGPVTAGGRAVISISEFVSSGCGETTIIRPGIINESGDNSVQADTHKTVENKR
jgi:crossover junction endodeoxyribonuclease RusA